jgi:hypothetical protein
MQAMNAGSRSYAPAGMRASDADRDRALTELGEHFKDGRLTSEELDERTTQALGARTLGDLAQLMTDLPDLRPAPGPAPAPAAAPGAGVALRRVAPLLVVIAIAAVAALVAGFGHGGHGGPLGGFGVVLPVLIIVRILAMRGSSGRRRR